jgi:hypothetical protein
VKERREGSHSGNRWFHVACPSARKTKRLSWTDDEEVPVQEENRGEARGSRFVNELRGDSNNVENNSAPARPIIISAMEAQ